MTSTRVIRWAGAAALATGMLMAQMATPPTTGSQMAQNWIQRRIDREAIILDLTPQQKTQMQQIANTAMTQAQPLVQQLRTNRQAIQQLITSGTPAQQFSQQLTTLANQQGQLVSQLIQIRATAMANAYSALTPSQQQKAIQLHEFGLGRGGGMHGMHGGGGGGDMGD